ncbi:threonine aldolase family protein [Geochorda subterranea]|uniref:threonine aldolase family protein n=1 Tax=Geochorda subterranea TaxID=3109564 RepID=UPI0038601733
MLKGRVDLRSDTVTEPTDEMRRAMYEAEVGDAARGDDPTVRQLEEEAAAILGKEAALLVPSGTMGNLVAMLTWVRRAEEIIADWRAHIVQSEAGGLGGVVGAMVRTIVTDDGILRPRAIEEAIRAPSVLAPRTALVAIEETHNFAGGTVWRVEEVDAAAEVAHRHGIPVHMDGARLFNAAVALGVPAARIVQAVDSVMFCLSKGLSAPIGSVLVGSRDFIEEARRRRQMVGGAMRQAGVIAAAGIVALRTMISRLAEDHARARALAERLAGTPGIRVSPPPVTNMVMVDVAGTGLSAAEFGKRLAEGHNVWALPVGPSVLRLVTHRHVDDEDVERAAQAIRAVAQSRAA